LKIQSTSNRTGYRTFEAALMSPVQGMHDLFLVARGERSGVLFNLTWFAFDKE